VVLQCAGVADKRTERANKETLHPQFHEGKLDHFRLLTLFFIAFASQIGRTESACALPASIVSCNISRLVNPRSGRYRTQDGYSPVENYTGLGL
jgi:hypothetical protein